MNVTVSFTAQIRQAAGASSRTIALADGATVNEAVAALINELGPDFKRVVSGSGEGLHPSLLAFVDGEPAKGATSLHEGADFTILSPIAGG